MVDLALQMFQKIFIFSVLFGQSIAFKYYFHSKSHQITMHLRERSTRICHMRVPSHGRVSHVGCMIGRPPPIMFVTVVWTTVMCFLARGATAAICRGIQMRVSNNNRVKRNARVGVYGRLSSLSRMRSRKRRKSHNGNM